jgi:hypothetical protein
MDPTRLSNGVCDQTEASQLTLHASAGEALTSTQYVEFMTHHPQ